MHIRFSRHLTVTRNNLLGLFAGNLVELCHGAPPDLSDAIDKMDVRLSEAFDFDMMHGIEFCEVYLGTLTSTLYTIMEDIPEVSSIEYLDIMAVAQCITCSIADAEDANEWLTLIGG